MHLIHRRARTPQLSAPVQPSTVQAQPAALAPTSVVQEQLGQAPGEQPKLPPSPDSSPSAAPAFDWAAARVQAPAGWTSEPTAAEAVRASAPCEPGASAEKAEGTGGAEAADRGGQVGPGATEVQDVIAALATMGLPGAPVHPGETDVLRVLAAARLAFMAMSAELSAHRSALAGLRSDVARMRADAQTAGAALAAEQRAVDVGITMAHDGLTTLREDLAGVVAALQDGTWRLSDLESRLGEGLATLGQPLTDRLRAELEPVLTQAALAQTNVVLARAVDLVSGAAGEVARVHADLAQGLRELAQADDGPGEPAQAGQGPHAEPPADGESVEGRE